MGMIDPNTSYEDISDELIIKEFTDPQRFKPILLYALMTKRANKNNEIKELLFDVVTDEKKRNERFLTKLPHAWIPVLFILEQGSEELKIELLAKLTKWSMEERKMLLSYVKTDKSYSDLLQPLIVVPGGQ